MSQRAYNNAKRELKKQQNRDAIVKTMVSQMADGRDDVSVAELAKESGVSLRTVYQHFPDKAARIEAINGWINGQVDMSRVYPKSFGDVPAYVERLIDYILQNEIIIRAQMSTGLSKDVRSYRKLAHAQSLRDALAERLHDGPSVERLTALIISTVRAEAVFDLRDIYNMTVDEIKSDLRRMIELFLEETIANPNR